jgi:hypothetical protein
MVETKTAPWREQLTWVAYGLVPILIGMAIGSRAGNTWSLGKIVVILAVSYVVGGVTFQMIKAATNETRGKG